MSIALQKALSSFFVVFYWMLTKQRLSKRPHWYLIRTISLTDMSKLPDSINIARMGKPRLTTWGNLPNAHKLYGTDRFMSGYVFRVMTHADFSYSSISVVAAIYTYVYNLPQRTIVIHFMGIIKHSVVSSQSGRVLSISQRRPRKHSYINPHKQPDRGWGCRHERWTSQDTAGPELLQLREAWLPLSELKKLSSRNTCRAILILYCF